MFASQDTTQYEMFYIIFCLKSDVVGHLQPYVIKNLFCVNLDS